MGSPVRLTRARPGRPRKFGRPSRAIALTLPQDVIEALGRLDQDLGRAVVRLSQPLVDDGATHGAVELCRYHDNAVIVVKPIRALESIPGVTLVPLPDGRALISLHESVSVSEFEVRLLDAIDTAGRADGADRSAMSSIAETLKSARQTKGISLHQQSIIVLKLSGRRRIAESVRRARSPGNAGRRSRRPF